MHFTHASAAHAVSLLRSDLAAPMCARGHNFAFEERVATERRIECEASLAGMSPNGDDLLARHTAYVRGRIEVRRDQFPATFEPANAPALLRLGPQRLVRLENIGRRVQAFFGPDGRRHVLRWFDVLQSGRNPADDDFQEAEAQLRAFVDDWNDARDARPMFAAFRDEVADELGDRASWPLRLRDRLGLGHHHVPPGGAPQLVALMSYTVEEVLDALPPGERDRCFAVPTVLDAQANAFFFPAPSEIPFGRTIRLVPDPTGDQLVSEILTRRMEYRLEHLERIGTIASPLPAHPLRDLRNTHLFWVRVESGRDAFGEEMGPDVAG